MEISTERLYIRAFKERDLLDMHAYCIQKSVAQSIGWEVPTSLEESAKILHGWIMDGRKHAIVFRKNGKVIGHIAINPDSEEGRADTREVGCALHVHYQRQGFMKEALLATIAQLFLEEGIEHIWACCFQNNVASKALIERCGFHFEQEGSFYASNLSKEVASYEYRITKKQWENDH